MAMSAFGVEDNRISKADDRRRSIAIGGAVGAGVGGATTGVMMSPFVRLANKGSRLGRDILAGHEQQRRESVSWHPDARREANAHSDTREPKARTLIHQAKRLRRLAIGTTVAGTAVGTGLGAGAMVIRNRTRKQ